MSTLLASEGQAERASGAGVERFEDRGMSVDVDALGMLNRSA
jgi:hypothetical protein